MGCSSNQFFGGHFELEDNMFNYYRYIVAFLGFLVHFNIFQTRMNLYIGIIEMSGSTHFNWTENEQATIMSSYFYGYMIPMAFCGSLVAVCGAKTLSVYGTVFAGLLTAVFPYVIKHNFTAGFIIRLLTGIVHAPIQPAMQEMLIPWSPHNEYTRLYFIQVSGSLIGNFVSFFIGGTFIALFGWENLFIIGGLFSIVTGLLYKILVELRPEECKFVNAEEIKFIRLAFTKLFSKTFLVSSD